MPPARCRRGVAEVIRDRRLSSKNGSRPRQRRNSSRTLDQLLKPSSSSEAASCIALPPHHRPEGGAVKIISPVDAAPWPTLGPQVMNFIRAYLPHGPGDLRGEPARIDPETEGFDLAGIRGLSAGPSAGRTPPLQESCALPAQGRRPRRRWLHGSPPSAASQGPARCDGFDRPASRRHQRAEIRRRVRRLHPGAER